MALEPSPLAVACTLSPDDLARRLALVRELKADALVRWRDGDLVLTLWYRAEARPRVEELVALERQCCAFLSFDVADDRDLVRVTVSAPERARDAAAELFAAFR